MEREQLIILIKQYMDRSISEENLILLRTTLKQKSDDDLMEIWDDLADSSEGTNGDNLNADIVFQKILLDPRIEADLRKNSQKINRYRTIKRVLTVLSAACILVLLKVGIDYISHWSLSESGLSDVDTISIIVPGGNKARIILADGSQIDLEQLRNDTTIYLDGYSVHKKVDGSIAYTLNKEDVSPSNIYNTIITPKGGEYKLTMADGTKVAINSSSTLRYPVDFLGDTRMVELTGEAYFDVSKQVKDGKRIPFIVKTDQQTLEVLGTSFNINSYGNTIQTTLVEGSVKLSFGNGESHLLKPSQQAVFEKFSKNTEIQTVDPFYVMAWKNGSFAFEGASIYEVMESVARWYDVEVSFKDELGGKNFSGTISRFENIDKLLKTIELTGAVKFEISGRRILVMK